MEPVKNRREFISLMKYAFAIRLGCPRSAEEVPTVGIVFGNYEIPARCHEYMYDSYDGNTMKIHITPGHITAKVELFVIVDGDNIFSAELNYDQNELMDFKDRTSPDSRVALIFSVKHGCDYYVTDNVGDNTQDFSPMVLAGYNINLL